MSASDRLRKSVLTRKDSSNRTPAANADSDNENSK